jgi:small-conductance mechanosensitive channel
MDTQLQSILTRIQSDISTNAKTWIPTPRKLDAESIISAVIVCVGFYLASIAIKKVAEKFFAVRKIDEALARFLIRVMRITLVSLGVVTALGTLGVDVSAIVAGLGLTGLAMGIALKDIVSNAMSGIMLLLFRPFRHRDHIKVAGFEGTVHDIDLRYTHLKTDGQIIFVPNSMMFANAVSVLKSAAATAALPLEQPQAILSLPSVDAEDEPPPEPTVEQEEETYERPNLLMTLAEETPDREQRSVAA